jgi:hypothetical protein
MKHFIIVFIVAIVTLSIAFAIYRPDLLEDVWLWLIGLAGTIIGFTRELIKKIHKFIKRLDTNTE